MYLVRFTWQEGNNDLFPTVYLLWAFPKALASLLTYSEVSPKLLGGADLMLQGLITPEAGLGEWEEGDARCVTLPDNHFPFAVGSMAVSSASLAKTGLKGRGLKLLHHFPDTCVRVRFHCVVVRTTHALACRLWQMGDRCTPDPSFTLERVFPIGATLPEGVTPASAVAQAPSAAPVAEVAEAVAALSLAPEPASHAAAGASDAESVPDTSTPEGMDAMLDWCLLRGLVDKVPDGELPIKCEELYSKVLLPARPAGTTVDIKKSGYKKLAKLYSVWEKKGLLTVKAVHKIDNIVAVNRQHAAYVAAAASASAAAASASASASASAAESTAAPGLASALIEVDTLYRSSSSLRPIFGDLLASNKDRLLSEAEISAALRKYGVANGLCPEGSDGKLVLDDVLCSGMYGKKEVETSGTAVPFDDLLARLLSKMSLFTRLRITRAGSAVPEEVLQKNAIKNIRITAEDRHAGRKHVTRVVGVEAFAIDPEELSSRIQKGYNTSCSVAALPGKNETGKEVAAQGNLLAEVADMMRKTYGIPERYLEVISKLK